MLTTISAFIYTLITASCLSNCGLQLIFAASIRKTKRKNKYLSGLGFGVCLVCFVCFGFCVWVLWGVFLFIWVFCCCCLGFFWRLFCFFPPKSCERLLFSLEEKVEREKPSVPAGHRSFYFSTKYFYLIAS